MCVLSTSFGNNDFQINKCAIILEKMDERMLILNITFTIRYYYIRVLLFFKYLYFSKTRKLFACTGIIWCTCTFIFLIFLEVVSSESRYKHLTC